MSHFDQVLADVGLNSTLAITKETVDEFTQQLVNLGYEIRYRPCGGFEAIKVEEFFGGSRTSGAFFKMGDQYLRFEAEDWDIEKTMAAIANAFALVSVSSLLKVNPRTKVQVKAVQVNV